MKKILFTFFALFLLGFAACKKDEAVPLKAYEDITYADIQKVENQFSDELFGLGASNGTGAQVGAVILYKTKSGILGKMIITDVSLDTKNLTFDMVNFKLDGSSELLVKNGVLIQSTWGADLDNGKEGINLADVDFYWDTHDVPNSDAHSFNPFNLAKFYVHSK